MEKEKMKIYKYVKKILQCLGADEEPTGKICKWWWNYDAYVITTLFIMFAISAITWSALYK